ncbi:hypothetical protein RclHR1_10520004 [Rhizophagus clarus]|uniref:Uncharacterized protein n=1 Tax=Rhizophagus clarus TaxID=94130 RepID=A0A2Z6QUA6_9GLOM|nr:hypothetical protein RclHR1_10520004 [Rhizophagus clarus]
MVDPITIITTVVPFFKTLTTAKNPLKTSVTIVFENNCSYTLIHPTKYCASGKDVNPPSPIISPGGINTIAAKFEGRNGTMGMLCYQIEGSYGPKNDPYYLIITWRMKRFSQSEFYMNFYESKESPLSGNGNQKEFFYESMHRSNNEGFLLEGKKLRVGGTITNNDSAEIKIFLENHKSPKKRLLRKIRSFLTKKFRKKKTR